MTNIKFGLEIAGVLLVSIFVLFAAYIKIGGMSSKKSK